MSDLIRQSVSWPYIHGARSYSRVTQLARPSGAETSEKAEETDRPRDRGRTDEAGKAEGATAPRRGAMLDLSV